MDTFTYTEMVLRGAPTEVIQLARFLETATYPGRRSKVPPPLFILLASAMQEPEVQAKLLDLIPGVTWLSAVEQALAAVVDPEVKFREAEALCRAALENLRNLRRKGMPA